MELFNVYRLLAKLLKESKNIKVEALFLQKKIPDTIQHPNGQQTPLPSFRLAPFADVSLSRRISADNQHSAAALLHFLLPFSHHFIPFQTDRAHPHFLPDLPTNQICVCLY
uniref:Uncharacterized protein n=1 Tax=Panagrellus redivivus TaxID=6233 RepID=A0A7E4VGF3_PANRE